MNAKKVLGLVAIVGFAKLAIGSHHHRMGSRGRADWQDRVAEMHRELHRRDAEANLEGTQAASAAGA
jgi:hypothetical protein